MFNLYYSTVFDVLAFQEFCIVERKFYKKNFFKYFDADHDVMRTRNFNIQSERAVMRSLVLVHLEAYNVFRIEQSTVVQV